MNESPKKLPGDICVLTTYFNPMGFKTKSLNFKKFRKGLQDVGIPLMVVENAIEEENFELTDSDADYLVRVKGGDVLWQKERMLNIGIQELPDDVDKVISCDADILFSNPNWVEQSIAKLEQYKIIQPFSSSIRLPKGVDSLNPTDIPVGSEEGQMFHSFASGFQAYGTANLAYRHIGTPGFAWGFRRETLKENMFYDRFILGGGDTAFAYCVASKDYHFFQLNNLPPKLASHLNEWRCRTFDKVGGSIGVTGGVIQHLWHGSKRNRKYNSRHDILSKVDYCPESDVMSEGSGPLFWSSDKPVLHKAVREYFQGRDEDRSTPKILDQIKDSSLRYAHIVKSKIQNRLLRDF